MFVRGSAAVVLFTAFAASFIHTTAAETPSRAGYAARDVITVLAPQPTNEPTYKNDNDFKLQVLNSTNLYRYEHNATAVAWNDSLAAYATNWTSDCNYHHSGSASGENIAEGYQNLSLTVAAWGDERNIYDFSHQGYAEETGHFTQLVWKATKTMGCGRKFCGDKQGWYVSCNYWPPGNVIFNGKFESEQVQSQVNQGQGYSYANGSQGLNSGNAGIGNYTAPAGGSGSGSGGGGKSAGGVNMGSMARDARNLVGIFGVGVAALWLLG